MDQGLALDQRRAAPSPVPGSRSQVRGGRCSALLPAPSAPADQLQPDPAAAAGAAHGGHRHRLRAGQRGVPPEGGRPCADVRAVCRAGGRGCVLTSPVSCGETGLSVENAAGQERFLTCEKVAYLSFSQAWGSLAGAGGVAGRGRRWGGGKGGGPQHRAQAGHPSLSPGLQLRQRQHAARRGVPCAGPESLLRKGVLLPAPSVLLGEGRALSVGISAPALRLVPKHRILGAARCG